MLTLGPFAFDPASGRLTRDGAAMPLGGRALAVLTALAQAEGTVTKEALLDAAWPGVTVEEGNLTVQIAALRKFLGEDTIVTVPRVGYRLRREAAPVAALPRLAVLPFEIIGGGAEDGYFADGLAEDLITALGRFRQFSVITRRAALAQGEALSAAGIRYAVTGSLRRGGAQLRIAARLTDTASGRQLWARQMDGAMDDLFAFQDRITEAVAAAVAPEIETAEIGVARRERTASLDAYEMHLRALAEIYSETEAGNRRARDLLSAAVAREPENALYLAYASWVFEHRITMGWPAFGPDDRATCLDLARRALQHAHGDPRAMTHAAMSLLQVGREYDLGMKVLERALEENPNNAMVTLAAAVASVHCGSLDRAETLCHRALALSPGDPMLHVPHCALSHIALIRGDYPACIAWATQSQAANPSFDPSLWMLIAAHAHLGQTAEAAAGLTRLLSLNPGASVARISAGQPAMRADRMAPVFDGLRRAGLPEA